MEQHKIVLDIIRTDLMLHALMAFATEPFYRERETSTTFNDSQIRAMRKFIRDQNGRPTGYGEVKILADRININSETLRVYLSLIRRGREPKHWRHIED